MQPFFRIFMVMLLLGTAGSAWGQFKEDEESAGGKLGEEKTEQWRCGIIVTGVGGACRGIYGYAPIPVEWPEQQVSTVKEDVSPEAKVSYRTLNGTVKIMEMRIPYLPAGQETKTVITLEVRRHAILPPKNTDDFVLPDLKKLPSSIRFALLPSPKIESRDPRIRKLAKELAGKEDRAWDKVKAIYDWVRAHVKYQNGPLKGAAAALKDGTGDCEEITSLFIALCRAADVPARTVWVPGHCYAEFYLEDKDGKGYWFPCQSAGKEEFGGISELRPILQKGDNFAPPHNPRDRQRYLAEHLTGTPTPGGGNPRVRFVRELVK
ncbi:MAG: transglutaminase domain-containing protein [Pirellulales bacterium]|nr:transglutaminase domain-containing protein [Pirellulales bacterium]